MDLLGGLRQEGLRHRRNSLKIKHRVEYPVEIDDGQMTMIDELKYYTSPVYLCACLTAKLVTWEVLMMSKGLKTASEVSVETHRA